MLSKKTIKHYMGFMSLVLVFVLILSTEARAEMFGFENVSHNVAGDAAIGEAQLFVDVTPYGGGTQVLFTFSNIGPEASSITDVYFEDGALLGMAGIINYPDDVVFSEGASPAHLPDSDLVGSANFFSTDSDSPVQPMGVNPGESLGIFFNLQSGSDFNSVLTAINGGFTNPDPSTESHVGTTLRIGIKVQGFATEGSESFVMTPVPGAVILGILGLGVAGLKLRKFA